MNHLSCHLWLSDVRFCSCPCFKRDSVKYLTLIENKKQKIQTISRWGLTIEWSYWARSASISNCASFTRTHRCIFGLSIICWSSVHSIFVSFHLNITDRWLHVFELVDFLHFFSLYYIFCAACCDLCSISKEEFFCVDYNIKDFRQEIISL